MDPDGAVGEWGSWVTLLRMRGVRARTRPTLWGRGQEAGALGGAGEGGSREDHKGSLDGSQRVGPWWPEGGSEDVAGVPCPPISPQGPGEEGTEHVPPPPLILSAGAGAKEA